MEGGHYYCAYPRGEHADGQGRARACASASSAWCADSRAARPGGVRGRLRAVPDRVAGSPLMAERRNRRGGAYALTVFTPILAGHEDAAAGGASRRCRSAPTARSRGSTGCTSRACRSSASSCYQGPQQRKRDRLRSSHLVFTSTFDGELDAVPGRDLRPAGRGRRTPGGSTASAIPAAPTAARSARWIRDHQVDSSLFASAHPDATVRACSRAWRCASGSSTSPPPPRASTPRSCSARFRERFAR